MRAQGLNDNTVNYRMLKAYQGDTALDKRRTNIIAIR